MFRLNRYRDILILDNISLRKVCGRTEVVKGIDLSFNLWVSVDIVKTLDLSLQCVVVVECCGDTLLDVGLLL